jgi:hypothetical protein
MEIHGNTCEYMEMNRENITTYYNFISTIFQL